MQNSRKLLLLHTIFPKLVAKEKENAARAEAEEEGIIHGDFAEFDDEEDKEIMEKSKKHSLRKKGINPNATKK